LGNQGYIKNERPVKKIYYKQVILIKKQAAFCFSGLTHKNQTSAANFKYEYLFK